MSLSSIMNLSNLTRGFGCTDSRFDLLKCWKCQVRQDLGEKFYKRSSTGKVTVAANAACPAEYGFYFTRPFY